MKVELATPDEYQGDLVGDVTRRRGIIHSIDSKDGQATVRADVPLEGNVRLRDGHPLPVQGARVLFHGTLDLCAGSSQYPDGDFGRGGQTAGAKKLNPLTMFFLYGRTTHTNPTEGL